MELPQRFDSEEQLEHFLAEPYPETAQMMNRLEGDVMLLGAGGKMGPTLALLAKRACEAAGVKKRVIAVSRFSDQLAREALERAGVETMPCDLLDQEQVAKLPAAENIIYMAGRKFGERGSEEMTWMTNVVVPAIVARAFPRSRFVSFSTGCVYRLMPVAEGRGSREEDALAPVGEYAHSCVGRERVFDYYSRVNGTPVCHYRLNYAIDMRYGVLVDIARAVLDNRPVDLSAPLVNVIWQGDANNRALLCLEQAGSPPRALNVSGPETLRVAELARGFGERFGVTPILPASEGTHGYLTDAGRSVELFGAPRVSVETMMDWIAKWLTEGGRLLGKPTHFEVTDGNYLKK